MSELLPCPACEGEKALEVLPVGDRHCVACADCGLRGPAVERFWAEIVWNALPRRKEEE